MQIRFKLVGRNRKFNKIDITDPLTLDDLMSGTYDSFFTLTNRYDPEYRSSGNCEFISEIRSIGLKDKNSVEIYEHDIIKLKSGDVYEVVYLEDAAAFVLMNSNHAADSIVFFYDVTPGTCEIIGNIFENSTLLSGKKW